MDSLKAFAPTASEEDLRFIISYCTNILQQRETSKSTVSGKFLDENFKYLPNFIRTPLNSHEISASEQSLNCNQNPDAFMANIRQELESLGLEEGNKAIVKTKWLVSDNNTQSNLKSFSSVTKNSDKIQKYPNISKLMELVNEHDDVIGELNGCIVNCFRGESSRHYAHADDEEYIDQSASIATVSLGPTRLFNIYEHKHRPSKVLKSFQLENGSLMIMQPGTQKQTKHKIEKQNEASALVRYSISFRKLTYGDAVNTPTPSPVSQQASAVEPPTTVIIGTSIADDLDETKLAGRHNRAKVIKLCKRGGHISQISTMLDELYRSNDCNSSAVKKVIISVGTNDIRRCRTGIGHLFYPVRNLVRKTQTYFPEAKIFIQSLIPIRYQVNRPENERIVENVTDFNKLLLKVATTEGCMFFNMFDRFLDCSPMRIPVASLFRDSVHLSSTGLSLLAMAFIKIIRGRSSPIINV